MRFFLRVTLGRREDVERVPVMPRAKPLPTVLTPEEVPRIIACAPGLKYRTALSVTYGAGLRASETASLKVADGGYAGDKLRKMMDADPVLAGVELDIVPRSDTAKGFVLLPRRWVVERTLGWFGRCRRTAKDWETRLESSRAIALISSIRTLTRKIARDCFC